MSFLVNFINLLFGALQLLILARVLLSWIPTLNPYSNQWVNLLYQVTEPILAPARKIIPPIAMMDISPVVVLIALQLLQQLVIGVLVG